MLLDYDWWKTESNDKIKKIKHVLKKIEKSVKNDEYQITLIF